MINVETRMTGKTTREVDSYIQEIFNNPNVRVRTTNENKLEDKVVYEKALARLKLEHPTREFREGKDGEFPWIAYIKLGIK